jgi:hypothetical protein
MCADYGSIAGPGQEHAGMTNDRHAGVFLAGIQEVIVWV